MDIFEKSSRLKLRFNSPVGDVTHEDLWDISMVNLNETAKKLRRQLRETEEEDFLEDKSKENDILQLKFDIVLHVLNTRKQEKKDKMNEEERKREKQKLMEILQKKQDLAIEGLSEKEIKKRIDALS